jgi:DNA-directed RNA polymerase subunit RPC12/RpoP
MAKSTSVHFACSNCNALYQVIKADAGPETTNKPEVACHICGTPLPAREGPLILKYFLLRKAGRRQIWKRKQSHAASLE